MKKNQKKISVPIVLVLILYFFYSLMGVLGKYNAVTSNVGSIRFILLLIVELIGLLLFTVIWQLLLTKFDLSFIYLFKGTTVLWGMVFAKIIFNESITACNLLGAIIIVIGIGVSLSE